MAYSLQSEPENLWKSLNLSSAMSEMELASNICDDRLTLKCRCPVVGHAITSVSKTLLSMNLVHPVVQN